MRQSMMPSKFAKNARLIAFKRTQLVKSPPTKVGGLIHEQLVASKLVNNCYRAILRTGETGADCAASAVMEAAELNAATD